MFYLTPNGNEKMLLGIREFDFRDKLKFLLKRNMQNGIPLNAENKLRFDGQEADTL